jgi:hypothetical protein
MDARPLTNAQYYETKIDPVRRLLVLSFVYEIRISRISFAACCALLLFVSKGAYADIPPSKTDEEAYGRVRKAVNEIKFHQVLKVLNTPAKNKYCAEFFEDLKDDRGLEIVEPIQRFEKSNHEALRPWNGCKTKPEIVKNAGGFMPFGTRRFRIYKLEVPVGDSSVTADILYSEQDPAPSPRFAGFIWWDLKSCREIAGVGAEQDDHRDSDGSGFLGDNYALLAKYRGGVVSVTLSGLPEKPLKSRRDAWVPPNYYFMKLTRLIFKEENLGKSETVCAWSTVPEKSGK